MPCVEAAQTGCAWNAFSWEIYRKQHSTSREKLLSPALLLLLLVLEACGLAQPCWLQFKLHIL